MKLQNKMIFLFAGTISIMCSAALLLTAVQSADYGKNLSEKLNTQLIESKAAEASSWLVQRMDELRIISRSSEAMAMDMAQIRPFIDRLNDEFSENYGNEYGTFALGGLDGLGYVTKNQTIDVSEREYFIRLLESGAEYTLSIPVKSRTDSSLIILLCYAIRDEQGEMVGFVNGAISLERLTRLADEIDFYGGSSFIADLDGNLYTNYQDRESWGRLRGLISEIRQGGSAMPKMISLSEQRQEVFFTPIPATNGWYLCTVVDHSVLFADRYVLMMSIVAIWAGLLLLTGVLSVLIGRVITRPVNLLSGAMGNVEAGDFSIVPEGQGDDEIARLTRQFNYMVIKIRELITSVEREQQERYRTQFRVLQNQINPHFLYNTLDSLQWKAMEYDADELSELICALSGFFRATLSEGRDFIPLEQEFEHLRYYLKIQQYRYEDILSYEIDMPEPLSRIPVTRLILQPLVENAIYHGIKPKLSPGRIHISAGRDGDFLSIEIEDDGIGMDTQTLCLVTARMEGEEIGDSIGLANVHQRLRLIYGSGYGITIASEKGAGTCVTVRLPGGGNRYGSDTDIDM